MVMRMIAGQYGRVLLPLRLQPSWRKWYLPYPWRQDRIWQAIRMDWRQYSEIRGGLRWGQ